MKLSKYIVLFVLFFATTVFSAYAQGGIFVAGPSNNNQPTSTVNRRTEERISINNEQARLRSNEIYARQIQIENNKIELNEVTQDFLKLIKENAQTLIIDLKEAKEISKKAGKINKLASQLRKDLELEDIKNQVKPLKLLNTETSNQHLTKLANSIEELVEQINFSLAAKDLNKIKLKILARHLAALEIYAKDAKDMLKQ
jgi:hypothetical protein